VKGDSGSERPSPVPFAPDLAGVQAMLAAIVASSDDAIVSKDLHGTIITWNAGAERIFGYSAEEVIGRPITILLPAHRVGEEAEILATLVRGERIDHFETERITKDGRCIQVSLSVSPITDRSGRIIGGAKIARDITFRKRLDAEREQILAKERAARTIAETANRAKDAFLAMISHELRTPLSPIVAWARMLRRGMLDAEKSQHALEAIERNAQAQAQIIDDLLDISRIVAGKLRVQVTSVDLSAVIEAAIEVVKPAADAKRIQLRTALDAKAGMITGDPVRLQQVIWNLLSNAIKFTPNGGRVRIALERVLSHAEVTVSDTGRGIPAEFLPHVFERFQQAEIGPTRSYGGLGLGLAIVRHIVELHGGTVAAESAGEGKGAMFRVKLPRPSLAQPAVELERRRPTFGEVRAGGTYPQLDELRILVVDDEPDSNEAVSTLLGTCGAEVRVAGSAAQGLEELQRWTPDVIISDIGMPGEDGYAFLTKVRARPGEPGLIPAIALTAYATVDDRVRIFSAGFQVHVVKPVDPAELVAAVASTARNLPRSR
jgi:PAS domain S-box-containing protein